MLVAALKKNRIHQGDCVELLSQVAAGSIDLVFADPPFNIGYKYDTYNDKQGDEAYLDWSRQWIAGVSRALKDDGTFWLAIGDDYAAELKWIATREVGLTMRSWGIWYYTFGVNCKRKFTRSHTHLFQFVKDPEQFTFNADDPAMRVPSARQLVYDRQAIESERPLAGRHLDFAPARFAGRVSRIGRYLVLRAWRARSKSVLDTTAARC